MGLSFILVSVMFHPFLYVVIFVTDEVKATMTLWSLELSLYLVALTDKSLSSQTFVRTKSRLNTPLWHSNPTKT